MSGTCANDFGSVLDERIREVSREVVGEYLAQRALRERITNIDNDTLTHQQVLRRIMSKEFISAKEASVLLNCSERHIHNLVDRARRGLSDNPIPYRKVGETTTFLRTELIEWTKVRPTNQLRAVG